MTARAFLSSPEFDGLFARFLANLTAVTDAASLVAGARVVLEAELVLLVRLDGRVEVEAVAPLAETDWARQHAPVIRSPWCDATEVGFSLDGECGIEGRRFADALICRSGGRALELVALQRQGGAMYTSYHVAVGAALLRQFVHEEERRRAEKERLLKELYSTALTALVLPHDTWESVVRRINTQHHRGSEGDGASGR